jgi:hypothetical protein
MKTKEELKNTYIAINGNEKLSKAVQEKLFEMGCEWIHRGKKILTGKEYCFTIGNFNRMATIRSEDEKKGYTQIFPSDLGLTDDGEELERGITIINVDNQTDFKVGDMVRCVHDEVSLGNLINGKIYEVEKTYGIDIKIRGFDFWYDKSRFELVSTIEKEPVYGDEGIFYHLTPCLRYKKNIIGVPMLQQMWQGSDGSKKWKWIEIID